MKRYREFVEERLRTKGEMNRPAIYVGEEFAGKLKKSYGMEEVIKSMGTSKKSQNKK